jgi:hypothetical protein
VTRHNLKGSAGIVGAAAAILAGCGPHRSSTASAGQPSASPTASARPASASSADGAANRLASPITYDQGIYRFDPPPSTLTPKRRPSDAYQSYVNTGVGSKAPQYSTPSIEFCLYTDFGMGRADANNNIIPFHRNQAAWMISFTNVPAVGSGGGALRGSTYSSPAMVRQNMVVVVDDATGVALEELIEPGPDPSPAPAP